MKDAQAVVNAAVNIVTQVVSVALLVLIAAAVAAKFGLRIPSLPVISEMGLAWLAGAWWLYRGGKIG